MRWFPIGLLILTAFTPSRAEESGQQKVAGLYERALKGDAAAVVECIALLENALKTDPENQLARVTLGSTYTLRSRDLGLGPKKVSTLRNGLKLMDEAVAADPEDARVRLIHARTLDALPGFLGRKKEARAAFLRLAEDLEKNAGLLSPEDRQSVFLEAGNAAAAERDPTRARKFWEQGLALKANKDLTARLLAALNDHGR